MPISAVPIAPSLSDPGRLCREFPVECTRSASEKPRTISGSLSPMPARPFDIPQCCPNGCGAISFGFRKERMVRILAITKEKFIPGAEIEHLWLALLIIALIGAVGLVLMMAVGH